MFLLNLSHVEKMHAKSSMEERQILAYITENETHPVNNAIIANLQLCSVHFSVNNKAVYMFICNKELLVSSKWKKLAKMQNKCIFEKLSSLVSRTEYS